MMKSIIVPVLLSAFIMGGCFGDEGNKPSPHASDKPAEAQAGQAGANSKYSGTVTDFCILFSQDNKSKTKSSYFKYNPGTIDNITTDMLGPNPNPEFIDNFNKFHGRYHVTQGMIELPLKAGNETFFLEAEDMWFNFKGSRHFYKAVDYSGKTVSLYSAPGKLYFGERTKNSGFEGMLEIGKRQSGGEQADPNGAWIFDPKGDESKREMGKMICPVYHYKPVGK